MACDCEVRLAGMSRRKAEPLALRAIAEVRRIEAKYSRYRAASVVSRINASAGSGRAVDVDDETAQLLAFAESLYVQSGGLFDVTSGILRRAWNFAEKKKPAQDQLAALLPRIGWPLVRRAARRIELPLAGMELDFGGFGKEYAADRAASLLQVAGAAHGLVNLGGDIRLIGARPDGSPWVLGIQHPRDAGATIVQVELASGALATSGDYERYFVDEHGQRYCHVLDPRTGWPVTAWQSISVTAQVCVAAGALTTIAMLKGADALAFLDEQQVRYVAVDAQGVLHRNAAPASAQPATPSAGT